MDPKGRLAVYERIDKENHLNLQLKTLLKDKDGNTFKLDRPWNPTLLDAGRRRLQAVDWDGDGRWDIVIGTAEKDLHFKTLDSITVKWLRNVGTNSEPVFEDAGFIRSDGWPIVLGRHCVCPFAVDWNNDGKLDLIVGAENGRIYFSQGSRLSR